MFPLDFPFKILARRARKGSLVLDPFCGRGTTNFAARLLGLDSLAVDSSPVATAITAAKLVAVTAEEIVGEAKKSLKKAAIQTSRKESSGNGLFIVMCCDLSAYCGIAF